MTGPHDEHDELHDPRHDPGHDPAEQARVRALLADLGSAGSHPPGPVPDDIAARLDATLADLADLGPPVTTETPATPATPGRPDRRRRAPRLLVAAAVAAVVGIGGVTTATLVSRSQEQTASSSAGGSSADSGAESGSSGTSGLPALTRAGFAEQAAALTTGPAAGPDDREGARAPGEGDRSALTAGCAPPPGRGELTAVLLEGEPAVLVARPVRDGRQVLQAWSCDAARVLATTRVAVPPS